MRSAVCSGEERGLILRTAAGNWAYSGIRRTETPYWWRHITQIRLVRKREKFAWTSQMHLIWVVIFRLRSFLKRLFAGKPVVASRNVSCFLSLESVCLLCWRARNVLGQQKQYGNLVPREPLAVNSLFMGEISKKFQNLLLWGFWSRMWPTPLLNPQATLKAIHDNQKLQESRIFHHFPQAFCPGL